MEKRTPMYSLSSIREAAATEQLRLSFTASQKLYEMGGTMEELFELIQSLSIREHFYKSMTSHADHRIWQDVYYIEWHQVNMYLKFTLDDEGYLVISFKPK
jgi:motility quorum-sensing regulator/GCU-specific mRNA interferase toxin